MPSTPADPFDAAMRWLGPIEGGKWKAGPTDPNDTMYGVTQRTYDPWRRQQALPQQSVFRITREEARAIYDAEYWQASGCDAIPWPLALVVFDTAVNCGVGNATKMYHRTHNAESYLDLRLAYYADVAREHPAKAPNLPNWRSRVAKLRAIVEAP
jgi:lysozyme family protein